jgi:hypothetical protein
MTTNQIISVSIAPYDGYEVPATLDSIATCGAKHVEPAFIQGSTEPFTEDAFTEAQPGWWRSMEFLQLLFPILYFEAGQAGTRILKQSLPKLSQ